MIDLKPWNESGQIKLEDNEHKKCACGIVTRSRFRLPYTNRVYVVCNSCFKDMANHFRRQGVPTSEEPHYTGDKPSRRKVYVIGD